MHQRLFLLVCLLAYPAQGWAAWAEDVAIAAQNTTGTGTTATFVFGGAVASGALLVCSCKTTTTVTTIDGMSDSVNSDWTTNGGEAWELNGGPDSDIAAFWYVPNSGAGTPTVTCTFSKSVSGRSMACGSFTGLATSSVLDTQNSTAENNTTTPTSGDVTVATSNSLAIGYHQTSITTPTITAEAGWAEKVNATHLGNILQVQTKNVAAGTENSNPTSDDAATDWTSGVAVFKEPAAAGTPPRQLLLGVGA